MGIERPAIDEFDAFVEALRSEPTPGSPETSGDRTATARSPAVAELLRHDREVQKDGFRLGDREFLDLLMIAPEDLDAGVTLQHEQASPEVLSEGFPRVGELIGRYRIDRPLGKGGMGMVYLAEDTAVGRLVALKTLRRGGLDRFEQEMRAIAALEHPGIVRFYDAGSCNGVAYFTMEYIAGETLEDRYKSSEKGVLDPREAAEIVAKAARAIEYAHSRAVLHRDLKPSNVFLGAEGTPRVGDFGLAKRLDEASDLTVSGEVFGSPAFMAPEQASGAVGKVGERTDVYGLGATLYTALVGRPPFQGPDSGQVLQLVVSEPPSPPSRSVAGVPADIETICLKCLEKSPAQRYPSASALAEDLERYLRGEPIMARPVSRLEKTRRWCRRKPTAAGLIAACLAATFLVVGWGAREVYTQRLAKAQLSDALVTRADLFAQKGNWRDALEDLRSAELLGRPDPRLIAVKRAAALLAVNDTDGFNTTLQELRMLAPLGPYLGDERLLRGLSLQIVGAQEEAQGALQEALACEDLTPAKRDIAAAMLAETSPESLVRLRSSVEKDPTSHFAQQYLIGSLVLLGRYEEAQTRCEVATALFPESPAFSMLSDFITAATGRTTIRSLDRETNQTDQVAASELATFSASLKVISQLMEQFAGAWCIDATEEEFLSQQETISRELGPLLARWDGLVSRRMSRAPSSAGDQLTSVGAPCVQRAFGCLADAGSMRTLGFVFTGKGDTARIDRIIGEQQAAFDEHPDAVFQLCRGRLLYARGREAEAAAAYDAAAARKSLARRAPQYAAYSAALCGLELHEAGDPGGLAIASRNLERCLRVTDWRPKRATRLMGVAVGSGDYDAALVLSDKVDQPAKDLLLARAALRAGRIEAAVLAVEAVEQAFPKDSAVRALREEVDDAVRKWVARWSQRSGDSTATVAADPRPAPVLAQ